MTYQAPPLPTVQDWRSLGVQITEELHAGKQSRVFAATAGQQSVAIKLTDADLADPRALTERMGAVETLADSLSSNTSGHRGSVGFGVARPVRLNGEVVHQRSGWLITATELVDGTGLDAATVTDASVMGQTLASLHQELARLPWFAIPPVASLRTDSFESDGSASRGYDQAGWQLLHADFSDANLIRSSGGLWILDFDDCGYGPPAYDVANSLYMVLFDSEISNQLDRYRVFRSAFLDGYMTAAVGTVDVEEIDSMINHRVDALDRWLADLTTAPIGIRTATPAWHQTLRAFVACYRSRARPGQEI